MYDDGPRPVDDYVSGLYQTGMAIATVDTFHVFSGPPSDADPTDACLVFCTSCLVVSLSLLSLLLQHSVSIS